MNKIISISINGIVFNVDEHAYLTLKNYLDALKLHFTGTEGQEEILSDIEARIAEMLLERMKIKREVVTMDDVEAIMAAMGKPEDMGEAEGAQQSSTSQSQAYERTAFTGTRRVFRNPDDKILGGVCSGVGNYFGLDPLILRLLFVVAFFGFGSGLLLYIILWIIIPAAKTPSEKLEMKGERVNVSNIEKTVKENLNDFKKKVDDWGNELKTTDTSKIGDFVTSLANDFIRVLKPVLMFLVKVFAIFLVIIAAIILFALIISLLGFSGVIAMQLPDFISDIFDSRSGMILGSLGLTLVLGIPVIALLYYALRIIFDIKHSNKWIGLSLVFFWLAGLGLVAFTSVSAINNFGKKETLVENVEIDSAAKIIYLDVNKNAESQYHFSYNTPQSRKIMKVKVNNDEISKVRLDIVKSVNGKLELVKEYSAHGSNEKEARNNAAKINYTFTHNDTQLIFNEIFNIEKGTKWRAHDVELILKVPVGQTIVMQPGMEKIIYDIDNTTNTYHGKMIGYKWLMTEQGFTCIDCPADFHDDDPHKRDWEIEQNSHKINYRTTLLIL